MEWWKSIDGNWWELMGMIKFKLFCRVAPKGHVANHFKHQFCLENGRDQKYHVPPWCPQTWFFIFFFFVKFASWVVSSEFPLPLPMYFGWIYYRKTCEREQTNKQLGLAEFAMIERNTGHLAYIVHLRVSAMQGASSLLVYGEVYGITIRYGIFAVSKTFTSLTTDHIQVSKAVAGRVHLTNILALQLSLPTLTWGKLFEFYNDFLFLLVPVDAFFFFCEYCAEV
jgi:hypothetical protein